MRVPAILLLTLLVSGCRTFGLGGGCGEPPEYNSSDDVAPLQVPPGLDVPDTRAALRIPPLEAPERPRGADERCLDAPPPFVVPKPKPSPQA